MTGYFSHLAQRSGLTRSGLSNAVDRPGRRDAQGDASQDARSTLPNAGNDMQEVSVEVDVPHPAVSSLTPPLAVASLGSEMRSAPSQNADLHSAHVDDQIQPQERQAHYQREIFTAANSSGPASSPLTRVNEENVGTAIAPRTLVENVSEETQSLPVRQRTIQPTSLVSEGTLRSAPRQFYNQSSAAHETEISRGQSASESNDQRASTGQQRQINTGEQTFSHEVRQVSQGEQKHAPLPSSLVSPRRSDSGRGSLFDNDTIPTEHHKGALRNRPVVVRIGAVSLEIHQKPAVNTPPLAVPDPGRSRHTEGIQHRGDASPHLSRYYLRA